MNEDKKYITLDNHYYKDEILEIFNTYWKNNKEKIYCPNCKKFVYMRPSNMDKDIFEQLKKQLENNNTYIKNTLQIIKRNDRKQSKLYSLLYKKRTEYRNLNLNLEQKRGTIINQQIKKIDQLIDSNSEITHNYRNSIDMLQGDDLLKSKIKESLRTYKEYKKYEYEIDTSNLFNKNEGDNPFEKIEDNENIVNPIELECECGNIIKSSNTKRIYKQHINKAYTVLKYENKIKLIFDYYEVSFYNDNIQLKEFNIGYIYNLDTKELYVQALREKKKKLAQSTIKKYSMRNPQYFHNIDIKAVSSFCTHIAQELQNRTNVTLPKFEDFIKNSRIDSKRGMSINDISCSSEFLAFLLFTKYPYLNYTCVKNIYNYDKHILYLIDKNKNNQWEQIMDLLKVPNTKFSRKVLRTCKIDINIFKFLLTNFQQKDLANYYFKKENVVSSLFNEKTNKLEPNHLFPLYSVDRNIFNRFNKGTQVKKVIKKHLNHLLKYKTNKAFISEISNVNRYEFKDIIMYMEKLKTYEKDDVETILKNVNFKQSFKNIHDGFNIAFKLIRTKNRAIQYNKTEKKLDNFKSSNNIVFKLPENTHRLIDIGSKMHICVGSLYADSAVNKESLIVYAIDKNDNYLMCIEIRGNQCIQCYKECNKYISNDQQIAVAQFFKKYCIIPPDYLTREIDDNDYISYDNSRFKEIYFNQIKQIS